MSLINPSPSLYDDTIECMDLTDNELDSLRSSLWSCIKYIRDPEHDMTLGQLGVTTLNGITFPAYRTNRQQENMKQNHNENNVNITSDDSYVLPSDQSIEDCEITIEIRPTVPHCSLATLIGLCIRTKVKQDWPDIKLSLIIEPDNHLQAHDICKQLNDKERCLAALENPALAETVESLIKFHEGMYD